MSEEQQQHESLDQREADQHDEATDDRQEQEGDARDATLSRLSQERREARERARKAEARLAEIEAKQREADEAKAKEDGQYKELLEQRDAELADLRKALAERDIRDKRAKFASDHKLPAEAMEFVTGDDDESIEASVKKLAKLFAREDGPDTDSGKRSANGSGKQKQESLLANYEFGKRR